MSISQRISSFEGRKDKIIVQLQNKINRFELIKEEFNEQKEKLQLMIQFMIQNLQLELSNLKSEILQIIANERQIFRDSLMGSLKCRPVRIDDMTTERVFELEKQLTESEKSELHLIVANKMLMQENQQLKEQLNIQQFTQSETNFRRKQSSSSLRSEYLRKFNR